MDKLNSRCDIYIQKNELLRCILESIGDAVYFADTQRRIILWNRATEALTGYKASEVIGRACSEILAHQNDQGQSLCETKCPLVSAMRGESFLEEVWMKTAYGVQKAIEINCSAVKSQEGEILGVVEVFRDRTQKKEIEELKENFYSTLTHDLKAPLGSIMGFVQLLKDPAFGEISPQKLEIADNILKSGSLFLSLINNIVDSSRIKNGQLHFSFENINLTKLLNDTKNTFIAQAFNKNIKFNFDYKDDIWVYGDYNKLLRVFHNLISNSLKHTPQGGEIGITVTGEEDFQRIEIYDTGPGIPKAKQNSLFRKFSQLPGEKEGSGLGLYIVHEFLKGHNSLIKLESKPDKGARFIFSLKNGKPEEKTIKTGRILMIGENGPGFEYARKVLLKEGHRIDTCSGGMEGLFKLTNSPADLVLAFNPLPDLELNEFIFSLGTTPRLSSLPILIISENKKEGKEWGKPILSTPINEIELKENIQKLLG